MKWNGMTEVFCPVKGERRLANGAKADKEGKMMNLRCTGCGQIHGEAKAKGK